MKVFMSFAIKKKKKKKKSNLRPHASLKDLQISGHAVSEFPVDQKSIIL